MGNHQHLLKVRVGVGVLHAAGPVAPWEDAPMRHMKGLRNAESAAEQWGETCYLEVRQRAF